jgi:hypothetical protein
LSVIGSSGGGDEHADASAPQRRIADSTATVVSPATIIA